MIIQRKLKMKFKKLIFSISKTLAIINKANSIKYLVDCGFSKNVIEFLLISTVSNN